MVEAFAEIDWSELEEQGLDIESVQAALALLGLVAGQDVEPAEGSDGTDGRWRIANRVVPDRVISTVDQDARHTRKSPEARRDGYRAHVVAEPETGIITDEALTKAAGAENSDAGMAETFLANDEKTTDQKATAEKTAQQETPGGTDQVGTNEAAADEDSTDEDSADEGSTGAVGVRREWYGDSAYGTGQLRAAMGEAGDEVLIKPKPLQAPVAGGFTVDDFTVDEDAGTVTCPAGQARPISEKTRTASFGALCRECPLAQQCTKSKTGRKIVLHPHDALLRRARQEWANEPEKRAKYRKFRPNVERVISQIASHGGRRLKLCYRGTQKNNAWLSRRTAGLNLRKLIGQGLTRTAGVWALAPQTG